MAGTDRRIHVPERVRRGEVFMVRTLARHPMEPGVRFDAGNLIVHPRHILQAVTAFYNGVEVFSADWFSSVSANPYLSFHLKAVDSGLIEVIWISDYNARSSASARIEVV
ncbi:thiosulfate oxidation carrier complex protein SoxZ [Minwuia thermotolerans]|uniref:Thiosulfate oxidation carrier complex protein SoxZ n=1 Tax=Minwuia thermotolerans TaxID=2056226 RepID=A0A2M9FZT7_9PROT|nr:thiosulfate oxidation carrier complex protein SoxZ [Minwuia thermotolerans]PJK28991.1 thiosulfate oxidation carrier complex protein SoxZ [Minwuia thermotolerans]